eukprot:1217085-Amorphochlora_amoeboformis.AAC.1
MMIDKLEIENMMIDMLEIKEDCWRSSHLLLQLSCSSLDCQVTRRDVTHVTFRKFHKDSKMLKVA